MVTSVFLHLTSFFLPQESPSGSGYHRDSQYVCLLKQNFKHRKNWTELFGCEAMATNSKV